MDNRDPGLQHSSCVSSGKNRVIGKNHQHRRTLHRLHSPLPLVIPAPCADTAYHILIGGILVFPVGAFRLNRLLRLKPMVAVACSFIMSMISFLLGLVLL